MNLEILLPAPPRHASGVEYFTKFPERVRARRILVAADDEGMRRLLSCALATYGFAVNAAADGEQAWDTLRHEHYDLLVTDIEMPRLAGIKLIERVRDAGMSLPIVIASGSLSTASVRDKAELQIAAVIPKPFGLWEFLSVVRIALRVTGETAAAGPGSFHQRHASPQPIR